MQVIISSTGFCYVIVYFSVASVLGVLRCTLISSLLKLHCLVSFTNFSTDGVADFNLISVISFLLLISALTAYFSQIKSDFDSETLAGLSMSQAHHD